MANHRQIERDLDQMSRKAAEQGAQTSRAMSETAERASRTASAALQRNTETFSKTWQSSSETASRIAERSMEQFADFFGLTGENARQSIKDSASSVQALMETSTVLTSGMQHVSGEWMRFMQGRFEENLKNLEELMSCRTIHDSLALQTRMARDNLEACLQSARRTSELSTKVADDAVKQLSDAALAPR